MISHVDKVLIDDLDESIVESNRIRGCLREALISDITGHYDQMKKNVMEAQVSIKHLDKLRQRKKDFDLAGEFLTPAQIECYIRVGRMAVDKHSAKEKSRRTDR